MKNGRRDESVIFSMQTFVVKLASGVAAFVASICLSINNLSSDNVTEAEQAVDFAMATSDSAKLGLRMTMTIIPVIGLFIAIMIFKKKFILTDEKVEELLRSKQYAALRDLLLPMEPADIAALHFAHLNTGGELPDDWRKMIEELTNESTL